MFEVQQNARPLWNTMKAHINKLNMFSDKKEEFQVSSAKRARGEKMRLIMKLLVGSPHPSSSPSNEKIEGVKERQTICRRAHTWTTLNACLENETPFSLFSAGALKANKEVRNQHRLFEEVIADDSSPCWKQNIFGHLRDKARPGQTFMKGRRETHVCSFLLSGAVWDEEDAVI